MPAGLTLNAASGDPGTPFAVSGTYNFTITATDSVGASVNQALSVVINPVLGLTTTTLASSTINVAGYSQPLQTSGGPGSVSFAVISGSLPTGLSLDGMTGIISGTPNAVGTFAFTVAATDSVNATASASYALTIHAAPSITTASLPDWTVGKAYSQSLSATGGTGAITFALQSGSNLPTGLSLSAGGLISGTPTSTGPSTFTIVATDSVGATTTATYTVTIHQAPTINTTSLPNWTINTPGYSQTISISNGTGALSFSVTAGSLPIGLSLNASTGSISGTPTTAVGTSSFTITVTDAVGATASQNLSITIDAALSITTTSLPAWTAGAPGYSQVITTSGGSGVVLFAVTGGSLPAGLSLSGNTISGTPSAAGTSSFTLTATDAANATAMATLSITINTAISITTPSLANGTGGTGYNQTLSTTGGTGAITFTVQAGSFLPAGLSLNAATGTISGTPTSAGTSTFTIVATDTVNAMASATYSVSISPAVSSSTARLAVNATTLVIHGVGFSTISANNTVVITDITNPGSVTVTGVVVNGAGTQLTLTITQSGVIGGDVLNAVVTSNTVDSVSTPVATSQAVITSSTTAIAANATTLTIHGVGFSPSANSVALTDFTSGSPVTVTNVVASPDGTTLTVTIAPTGLTGGDVLNAIVTTNSVASASAR